jgi:hypothetical protein
MTASTMEPAPAAAEPRRAESARSDRGRPSRLTLEDVVLGAWEDLGARGLADCPVCRGPLELSGCRSCGSHLS